MPLGRLQPSTCRCGSVGCPTAGTILDSVVTQELSANRVQFWLPLHAWCTADDRANHNDLESLRSKAGLGHDISVLPVFDVLTGMTGKGCAKT